MTSMQRSATPMNLPLVITITQLTFSWYQGSRSPFSCRTCRTLEISSTLTPISSPPAACRKMKTITAAYRSALLPEFLDGQRRHAFEGTDAIFMVVEHDVFRRRGLGPRHRRRHVGIGR